MYKISVYKITAAALFCMIGLMPRAAFAQVITISTEPLLCLNQGGTLLGPNIFTAADNGTFGTNPSTGATEIADPNPYPGLVSGTGYQYETTGIAAPFNQAGDYMYVSNVQTRAFSGAIGHIDVIDADEGIDGRYLVVNGSTSEAVFYSESLTGLTQNTNYEISLWYSNLIDIDERPAGLNDPNIEILIDGTPYYSSGEIAETSEMTWYRVGFVFNTGNATTANISFEDKALVASGNDFLLDNIRLRQCIGLPSGGPPVLPSPVLSAQKTIMNLNTSDYSLPGVDVVYTIEVENTGDGAVDDDTLFLSDKLPDEVTFFNGDFDGAGPITGPIEFTETGSGLTFTPATDVAYSNLAAAPASYSECNYTPTAGYDSNIQHVCFAPKGGFLPSSDFSVSFRTRID